MPKTEMDVEKLLTWAYRDELSKRQTSAAEGIWDRIEDYGQKGGIDHGHGAAQRYAHFGLPDPDAEAIERAVGQLEDVVVDWGQSLPFIAGELAGLVSVNDFSRRSATEPGKSTTAEWTGKNGRRVKAHDRPRDMLMLGALRTKALVTMHAIQGTRPDWRDEQPMPYRVQSETGSHPKISGTCEGKNRYSLGSYCLLQWDPSPTSIITARAEYVAWWEGLLMLSGKLSLANHIALPPSASVTPWLDERKEDRGRVIPVMPTATNNVGLWGTLPLNPIRSALLKPFRRVVAT